MEINAQTLNSANAKAEVKIDAKELQSKVKSLASKAAKSMKIDGFRPGKVPVEVVIKRYGKDLEADAKNELFGAAVNDALKDLNKDASEVIGDPMVRNLEEKDGVIEASLEISFKPKLEISEEELNEIMPSFSTPRVTKKEIDEKIEELLKQIAPLEKIEKDALEKGDFAKFDFEGFLDGKAFDGGKANDFVLEIGSGQFIPGFEDGMIGLKPGEEKDITVTFPSEYGAKDLAGKETVFKVKLHEIQAKGKGELNEATLKQFMPNEENPDEEKLKEDIKKQIRDEKFYAKLGEELKPEFAKKALEKFKFDLPSNIVEQEINMRFRNDWGTFSAEEQDKFQNDEKAFEEKKESYKQDAEESVALTFVIDAVAKLKKIEVSDQELVQAIYFEAYRNGLNPKDHLEYYKNQGMLAPMKMALVEEKLFAELFNLDKKDAKEDKGE